MSRRRSFELGITLLAPLLLLALWEGLSRSAVIDPRFWPAPSSLWQTSVDLLRDGTLAANVRVSLVRIGIGFTLGAIPAVVLGLAMGLFWPVRVFLMPIAAAIYAVPKIALLPLVFLVFGLGEMSKYVMVAISVFFLVMLNTMAGVLAIDPAYRDVAKNFGASPVNLFLTVALPGALPSIFTGLRLGLGFSLLVIVGTEYIAAREGIGYFIYQSYTTLAIKQMFVGLFVTGLMGWVLTLILDFVERLMLPWHVTSS